MDLNKIGIYTLRLKVGYGFGINMTDRDFLVEIKASCQIISL